MNGKKIYSRNWRAKVNGKGMSIIWSSVVDSETVKKALISKFCSDDVEVFQ